MLDVVRRAGSLLVPVAALVIIVVGLWPGASPPVGPAERTMAIADSIACPFCEGESIAESTAAVAADYQALIREWVEDGLSDQEIYDRFRARFGEGIVLDGGTSGWGRALWLLPVAAVVVGTLAVLGLRRRVSGAVVEEPVEEVVG